MALVSWRVGAAVVGWLISRPRGQAFVFAVGGPERAGGKLGFAVERHSGSSRLSVVAGVCGAILDVGVI